MESNKEIVKGMTLFVTPNRHDGYTINDVTKEKVSKVGNKYFELEGRSGKWKKDDMRFVSEYTTYTKCYFTLQEISDVLEIDTLSYKIRSKIGSWGKINLPLESLRRIMEELNSQK